LETLLENLYSNDNLTEMESIYIDNLEKQYKYYTDREILIELVIESEAMIFEIKFLKTAEINVIDKVINNHISGNIEGIELGITNNDEKLRRIVIEKNEKNNELVETNIRIESIDEKLSNWTKNDVSAKSGYINSPWKISKGDYNYSGSVLKDIKEIIVRTNQSTDVELQEISGNTYKIQLSSDLFRSVGGVYFIMIDGAVFYDKEIAEKIIERDLKIIIKNNLEILIEKLKEKCNKIEKELEKSSSDIEKLNYIKNWIDADYLDIENINFYINLLKENSLNYFKILKNYLEIDFNL